jgi:uncharacterized membrane protein
MSEKKIVIEKKQVTVKTQDPFFTKDNYMWMVAGIVVIALGMLLMAGGKSNNPAVFDQKEVYSTTRITIAPLVILIGLALEIVAIFKRPKSNV